MTNFSVEIDDTEVRSRLSQLLEQAERPAPMMAAIASELQAQTELAFVDEGPNWAELSDVTKALREKQGKWPGMILQQSNALARSITAESGDRHAQIGTNLPYAAMQHFGGVTAASSMIPGKEIPARPFLPVDDAGQLTQPAHDAIVEIIQKALS